MSLPDILPTGAMASGKECTLCGTHKLLSEFYRHPGHPLGSSSWCRKCTSDQQKLYRAKHPEYCKKMNANRRSKLIKLKYGITKEQYESMMIDQDRKCLICGVSQDYVKKLFSIDHDHNTGKVRGLLCHKCNVGMGHFDESPGLLRKAAKYLEHANGEEKS